MYVVNKIFDDGFSMFLVSNLDMCCSSLHGYQEPCRMVANPLFEELADMPLSYRHSTTYLVSITVHEDDDRHDVICFCVVWEVGVNPTLTLNANAFGLTTAKFSTRSRNHTQHSHSHCSA